MACEEHKQRLFPGCSQFKYQDKTRHKTRNRRVAGFRSSNTTIAVYPQFLQVQLLPQLQLVQVQFGLLHFCPLAPFARRRLDVVFIKKLFDCF